MQQLEKELEFFNKALIALKEIPNDYRSRNHTDYLSELEERVYELNEALKFIAQRQ